MLKLVCQSVSCMLKLEAYIKGRIKKVLIKDNYINNHKENMRVCKEQRYLMESGQKCRLERSNHVGCFLQKKGVKYITFTSYPRISVDLLGVGQVV